MLVCVVSLSLSLQGHWDMLGQWRLRVITTAPRETANGINLFGCPAVREFIYVVVTFVAKQAEINVGILMRGMTSRPLGL